MKGLVYFRWIEHYSEVDSMVSFHDWQNYQQWYSNVNGDSLHAWNEPSLDFAANNLASQTARGSVVPTHVPPSNQENLALEI